MSKFGIFLASMILCGLLLLFCVAVDASCAVRKKRVVKPVEFFAPEGYSPIDVALVYSARRMKANALFTPLLLYWADCGYVTVEEDGRGLKVKKRKALPPFEESGRTNRKTYDCELCLFNDMFSSGDTFYTLAAQKSIKETYEKEVEKCKALSRAVVGKTGRILSLAMKAAAVAVLAIISILISLYSQSPIVFIMLFPVIGTFLIKFMPAPAYARIPFMALWGGLPLLAALFLIPLPTVLRVSLGVATLMLVCTVCIFAEHTDFREEAELKIYGKVCSFKRFLTVADKNRLEMLVEDYPDYFYDVLPFFYVFGITKKMKKKFDRIIPEGSFSALGPIRDIYVD